MLFINRRGYSAFVMCRGCGYVEYCDNCEVTMTYHATRGKLLCHYCAVPAFKYGVPVVRAAVSQAVRHRHAAGGSAGQELFPEARVRMDLDTTRAGRAPAHLRGFQEGRGGYTVGTQMIAKGLDFANVTLVGVVSADSSLYIPDYRSPEKTFQLLEQVAGRAGRKDPGKVVAQTYSPDHYAVELPGSTISPLFQRGDEDKARGAATPYSVFSGLCLPVRMRKKSARHVLISRKGLEPSSQISAKTYCCWTRAKRRSAGFRPARAGTY